MRKLILLFSILFLAKTIKAQIVFCPPGAEWHYSFGVPLSAAKENFKIKYVRDTTIGAEMFKVLQHRKFFYFCEHPPTSKLTLIKQHGDTVFMRNPTTLNNWQVLYNFAAQPGQTWTNVLKNSAGINITYTTYVDSVRYVTVNNYTLKQLAVNYAGISTYTNNYRITERLGVNGYLFNYDSYQGCDDNFFLDFLCYQDNAFGIKQFTSYDCNYSNPLGINDKLETRNDKLKIYPNPSSGMLTIQLEDATLSNYNLKLINVLGQEEKLPELVKQNDIVTLNIQQLKKGIYFLHVFDKGKLICTEKIIKE
jgi:hypothetical protein